MTDVDQLGHIEPLGPLVADQKMSASARARLYRSVPANTRRAYARVWDGRPRPDAAPPERATHRGFTGWCELHNRTPMPATPQTLAEYVAHLADAGKAPATIEQAIAAIRTRHRLAGHGKHYPDADLALAVLRDHRRDRAAAGRSGQRQALPVLVESLRKMVDTIDPNNPIGARDHALLLLGVVMFARRSEIAALDWDDLTDAPEGMLIRIRMSKTDADAKGEQVPVLYGAFPGTDPIRVLDRWRDTLAARSIPEGGPVLRSVTKSGHIGGRLSTKSINTIVQRRARLAGLGAGYSAHSLRAGAATIAHLNGAPVATICRLGRWTPGSRAVLGYIRSVDQWKDHPFRGVL
jgi:integrase